MKASEFGESLLGEAQFAPTCSDARAELGREFGMPRRSPRHRTTVLDPSSRVHCEFTVI